MPIAVYEGIPAIYTLRRRAGRLECGLWQAEGAARSARVPILQTRRSLTRAEPDR